MRIRFATVPLALLLLSGCGAPDVVEESSGGSSSVAEASPSNEVTPEDAEPAAQVDQETSCLQLSGFGKGPYYQVVEFVDGLTNIDPATVREARELKEKLDLIAEVADANWFPS